MLKLSVGATALLLGAAYQQALVRAPNFVGGLWEIAASEMVPAVLSVRAFIVTWDLVLTFLLALVFTGALVTCRCPIRWRILFLFLGPTALYQVWDYVTFWGSFGVAEADYWRRMLNACAAVFLPMCVYRMCSVVGKGRLSQADGEA